MMSSSGAPTSPMNHLLSVERSASAARIGACARLRVPAAPGGGLARTAARLLTVRIDVFTIFPGDGRGVRRRRACSAGPAPAGCSTCGPTTSAPPPPTCTARSTTARSGAAPAWCSCPSRCSPRWRRSIRRGRCSCSGPAGRRFDQALARELAGDRRVQPAVRPLRGRRRPGPHHAGGRRAVGRATSCWPAARWRRWWSSRRSAGWCPGVMGNDTLGRRRVVRRRAARVPAVHPPGRLPGLRRCRRCCARATTRRVSRWRRARALAAHAAATGRT